MIPKSTSEKIDALGKEHGEVFAATVYLAVRAGFVWDMLSTAKTPAEFAQTKDTAADWMSQALSLICTSNGIDWHRVSDETEKLINDVDLGAVVVKVEQEEQRTSGIELTPGMRVVVRTDGTVTELDGKQSFEQVYRHIGHGCECIDVVNLRQHGLVMLVDDNAAYRQPEVNQAATALYYSTIIGETDWQIRGNVVIVPDGDFA